MIALDPSWATKGPKLLSKVNVNDVLGSLTYNKTASGTIFL